MWIDPIMGANRTKKQTSQNGLKPKGRNIKIYLNNSLMILMKISS